MSSLSKTPDENDKPEVQEAWELGKDYSPDDVCHHCARCPTGEMDTDTEILNKLKRLAGWVEQRESDFSPPDPNAHSLFCDELYPAFRDGFWNHCTSPANCKVCSAPKMKCYHERQGLGGYCPQTGGDKEIF
jgi:hypothetical protein